MSALETDILVYGQKSATENYVDKKMQNAFYSFSIGI